MNKEVNFELAKLLKEKGFDIPCTEGWINYLTSFTGEIGMPDDESNLVLDRLGNPHLIERPTIAEVVMWLYEKHGIWINVYYKPKYKSWDYGYTNTNWSQEEVDKKLKEDIDNLLEDIFNAKIKYNSPTEAYKAAIEHILTELIK